MQVFINPWLSLHFARCLETLPLWGYKYHYMAAALNSLDNSAHQNYKAATKRTKKTIFYSQ